MIMASVIKASSKQMQMEYRYDDQGYPLGKTTKSNDKTLSVSATPSTDPIKRSRSHSGYFTEIK